MGKAGWRRLLGGVLAIGGIAAAIYIYTGFLNRIQVEGMGRWQKGYFGVVLLIVCFVVAPGIVLMIRSRVEK